MSPLAHVQPGNLITSQLINAIIDQINGLGGRPGDLPLILGPLAEQTHTLVALGTGFESNGGIWLDGEPLLASAPGRGISLVILEPNLTVKFRGSYDTFGDAGASARLARDIQASIQPYDVVVGVTHDAFARQLRDDAKAALASIGAAALGQAAADTRSAAAFIGVVPPNRASAQFNYIVSVLPSNSPGFAADPRLVAQPFAWGTYNVPMQRFVVGGASGQLPGVQPPPASPTTSTTPTRFTRETTPTQFTRFTRETIPTEFTSFTRETIPTEFTSFTIPTDPFATIDTATIGTPDFGLVLPEDEVTVLPGLGMAERDLLTTAGISNVIELVNTPVETVANTLNISHEAAAGVIGMARRSLGS